MILMLKIERVVLDHIEIYESEYDYFALDFDALEYNLDVFYFEFLFNLFDSFNTEEDKYSIFKEVYYSSQKTIFKIRRCDRNVAKFPMEPEQLESLLSCFQDLEYNW